MTDNTKGVLCFLTLPLILVLTSLTLSCAKDPVSTQKTNNSDVSIGLLFEHDGCRVYRFMDAGEYIYYVTCGHGAEAATSWERSCGKNCVQHEIVPEAN